MELEQIPVYVPLLTTQTKTSLLYISSFVKLHPGNIFLKNKQHIVLLMTPLEPVGKPFQRKLLSK